MNISKFKNRIQTQEFCNSIIQQNKLSRQGFYDLTILQNITKCKSHIWYSYIKYVQLILTNYRNRKQFNSQKELKQYIQNKYNYYKQYQQQISDIEIKIVIQKNLQIQILGHYFDQEKYIQNFVCIFRFEKNTQIKIINENELRQNIYKLKLQILKQEQKILYLSKEKIQNFVNNS